VVPPRKVSRRVFFLLFFFPFFDKLTQELSVPSNKNLRINK
jgi:hypothetical protein